MSAAGKAAAGGAAAAPPRGALLRAIDAAADTLAWLGGAAAAVLVAVVFVTVIWRYGLGRPIYGIDDIAKMTLAVCVAGSLAYGARRGAHVQVDVLDKLGGRRVTRYSDLAARLVGIATLAFTAAAMAIKGACGEACGNFTADLRIPHAPFYFLLAAGFGLYALVLVGEALAGLRAWSAARDPNEHGDV